MFRTLKCAALCVFLLTTFASAFPVRDRLKHGRATLTFRIDAARSKFMVIAPRGGLAYFKGHSHYLAVREFDGIIELTPGEISPASLKMAIRSASIEETGADFTDAQKKIIKKELEDIVLETTKFPEITFRSTDVKGRIKNGTMIIDIGGDITLHGVTKHVVLPAAVTVAGGELHAKGEFRLDRKKFGVNATDAFHGLVRVRHTLRFTFDIVARAS